VIRHRPKDVTRTSADLLVFGSREGANPVRQSTTYFEQIAVEAVKKIAEEDGRPAQEIEKDDATQESAAKKTNGRTGPALLARQKGSLKMENPRAIGPEQALKYPEWQEPLRQALLELDKDRLKARIATAEMAVFNRLQTLTQGTYHPAERQALEDALATLRVLKRDASGSWDGHSK
jgi:hypothetical protein